MLIEIESLGKGSCSLNFWAWELLCAFGLSGIYLFCRSFGIFIWWIPIYSLRLWFPKILRVVVYWGNCVFFEIWQDKAYYSKLPITWRVLYLMIHQIYARYLVVNFYQSIFDPALFGIDQPRNPTFWWHLKSILHPGHWWLENSDRSFCKICKNL